MLAIYIEEYVPKTTPNIIAREKPFKISPPKKNIDNKNLPSPKAQKINLVDTSNKSTTSYFGYNFFEGDINFFDNTPTPPNYKLGPGDEIILSLWGETNSRNSFTINKEGFIYYDSIGFINLSNNS